MSIEYVSMYLPGLPEMQILRFHLAASDPCLSKVEFQLVVKISGFSQACLARRLHPPQSHYVLRPPEGQTNDNKIMLHS